jgi:hypothetical protein
MPLPLHGLQAFFSHNIDGETGNNVPSSTMVSPFPLQMGHLCGFSFNVFISDTSCKTFLDISLTKPIVDCISRREDILSSMSFVLISNSQKGHWHTRWSIPYLQNNVMFPIPILHKLIRIFRPV